MTPERWSEVARIFGLAVEVAPGERRAFVERECGDDQVLRHEVLELLAADERSGDVLVGVGAAVREVLAATDHAETSPDSGVSRTLGDVIDERYRIERIIGSGGMGMVVEAVHIELRERVAMKLLHPQIVASTRSRERFLREARAVASLKSPHIVRMRDVGIGADDAPYMVMDLLHGVDLAQLLAQRGPLPVEEAAMIVLQACDALAVAHDAGIVHRDIKPANLFLEQDVGGVTTLKLLDFGVSKHSDDDQTLTESGDRVGSPAYMSPEQLRSSRDVDARSDIWSLGVVLYELVAGRRPFAASSTAELYSVVLQQDPAALPEVPAGLRIAIERCLHKDRERRYASVSELASQLAPLAGAAGYAQAARVAKTSGVVAPIAPEPTASRARVWVALALALAIGAIALAWIQERPSQAAASSATAPPEDAAPAPITPPAKAASAAPEPSRTPAPQPVAAPVVPPKPAPLPAPSRSLDPYGSRL